jgi:outer membrane protein assembly factor BamB
VVVVRTADGRIFGLSSKDGHRLWVFQRATPALLLRSEAGVLAIGGDVVAGYPNGKLIALDLDDGKLTWEVSVSLPHGATELERIADVAGLPVIDGTTICAAAFQGKIACFDIASRNQLWARDLSSALDLASDAKNLYAVDDTGAVHALAKSSGAAVWKQDKLRYRRVTSPEVSGAYVLVGDGSGYVHVLSPDNGEIVGRIQIDSSAVRSILPTPAGVLVQTSGGTLALVRL